MRRDNRQSSNIWGIVGLILAIGWILYVLIGTNNHVFLTVMIVLSIALGGFATFMGRRRAPY
jgi:hypothetical protein